MTFDPGQLRHVVSVQQLAGTEDGFGNNREVWTDLYANVYAAVQPVSGRELYVGEAARAELSHKVTLWYVPGISSGMRVLFGSRKLYISSIINPDEGNVLLYVFCQEKPD